MATANRLVLSHPTDLSDWGRSCLDRPSFRAYLRRVHDRATAGDSWEEFVGVGCCGSALDVPLRVERVDGGTELDDDTTIEYVEREACDLGGWQVQSEAGPTG